MNLTDYVKTVSLEDFDKPFLHTATWNARLRTTGGRFFQLMVILILIRSFMKHLEKKFFEKSFDMSFAIIIFILKVKATSIQMLILKNCCEKLMGFATLQALLRRSNFTAIVVKNVVKNITENAVLTLKIRLWTMPWQIIVC